MSSSCHAVYHVSWSRSVCPPRRRKLPVAVSADRRKRWFTCALPGTRDQSVKQKREAMKSTDRLFVWQWKTRTGPLSAAANQLNKSSFLSFALWGCIYPRILWGLSTLAAVSRSCWSRVRNVHVPAAILAQKHSSSVTALSQTARMQPLDALRTPQEQNELLFFLLLFFVLNIICYHFHGNYTIHSFSLIPTPFTIQAANCI